MVLLATLLIAQTSPDDGSGLVYDEGCAFFVDAPKGWILDNVAGKSEGLPVVFYPKGSSWKSATTAIYVRSAPKSKGETLTRHIADDQVDFLKKDSKMVISSEPMIKTGDQRAAPVCRYDSAIGKQHDLVAFVDLPKAIVTLCLTSRTPAGRSASRAAFAALVSSFRYVTDKVEIRHRSAPR